MNLELLLRKQTELQVKLHKARLETNKVQEQLQALNQQIEEYEEPIPIDFSDFDKTGEIWDNRSGKHKLLEGDGKFSSAHLTRQNSGPYKDRGYFLSRFVRWTLVEGERGWQTLIPVDNEL